MEISAQPSRYPACLIKAANEQIYQPKPDILRVSELVDAPLIKYLTMKHWDQCSQDIENSIPALMGTAWHRFLESYTDQDTYMAEQRLWATCDGTNVTGQMDLYQKPIEQVEDHKSISATKLLQRDTKDWECRMNTYAWLCRQNNIPVKSLVIWAFIKDWSKYKMMSSQDYPRRRLVAVPIPLWKPEQQDAYVRARVQQHQQPPTECAQEEKWAKEPTFALKKVGRKTAVKVEDSRNALLAYMREKGISLGKEYSIELRPGECVRCADWCIVREFCPYAKQLQQEAA